MSSRSACTDPLMGPVSRVVSGVVSGVVLGVVLTMAPACKPRGTDAPGGVALRIDVVDADADADVFVDGHYVGTARALGTDKLGTIQLTPGTHRVEVRKAGRFPVQRTVKVDGSTPDEVVLTAELLEDPQ